MHKVNVHVRIKLLNGIEKRFVSRTIIIWVGDVFICHPVYTVLAHQWLLHEVDKCISYLVLIFLRILSANNCYKCSAVAEMGDCLATIDMDGKLRSYAPLGRSSYLTQCGQGRGLPPCQVSSSSWSIQPFGHNRHGPRITWTLAKPAPVNFETGGRLPCPFPWGELGPHLTMWPTCVPSFILIHPTIWPQYTKVMDRQTDRQDRQTMVR